MGDPYRQSGEEPHAGTEMLWLDLLRRGPIGLLRYDFSQVERTIPEVGRLVFKHLLGNIEKQTEWIVQRTASLRDEAERIALIGQTMKHAGLRSYTDKDGATFVASETP